MSVTSTSQAITSPVDPGATAPAARELHVTVSRIDVHVADTGAAGEGASAARQDSEEASNGWTTLFEGAHAMNLLQANAAASVLGASDAPVGKVTQVRLVMDDAVELVEGGESFAVSCPSCVQTGLKLVTAGQVEVESDGILQLMLDFDADASLVEVNGSYVLTPVVRVESTTE